MRFLRTSPAALALLLGVAATSHAAEPPTRAEYVTQLERICKPRSEATQRAVRGTPADVRSERLRRAAEQGREGEGNLRRHRPPDLQGRAPDRRRRHPRPLVRRAAARDSPRSAAPPTALRAEDVARFQRVWANFIHEGNKANNVVLSFGFDYCNFKPSRFT